MLNITEVAKVRGLDYLHLETSSLNTIIEAIMSHKKIKFVSVLEDGDRLRGYERNNKELLILFGINYEVCTKVFKDIKDMLSFRYFIYHTANRRDLIIEL